MSSADQIERLLALVPLLQRSELSVKELASEFQCTEAQIMKDLRTLWLVGPSSYYSSFIDINIEVIEADHDSVVQLSNADYLTRPMRLTKAEASALLVALQLLPDGGSVDQDSAVARTITKIQNVSAQEEPQAQVLSRPEAAEATRVLMEAIRNNRSVEMTYFIPTRDETTRRRIDPVEVIHHNGQVYVDAWCHLVAARRLFRLDRVVSLEASEASRSGADLHPQERSSDSLFDRFDSEAVIDLAPEAAWFAHYHPISSSTQLANGNLRVTLPLVNSDWLLQEISSLAGKGQIVEPVDLANRLRNTVVRVRSLYDPASDSIEASSDRTPRSS